MATPAATYGAILAGVDYVLMGAVDVHGQPHGTPGCEIVEELGDLPGDAGAHQDVVDPRQDGAVGGGRCGHLDLLEEVDPDETVVALLGQPDLREVGQGHQLLGLAVLSQREARERSVGSAPGASVGAEVGVEHPRDDPWIRERGEGPPHRTIRVSVLEAPGHHHVKGGAGDHSELSVGRNGGGESPRGHANTHPTLDHGWQCCVVAPRGGWCHRSASPTYGGVGY